MYSTYIHTYVHTLDATIEFTLRTFTLESLFKESGEVLVTHRTDLTAFEKVGVEEVRGDST